MRPLNQYHSAAWKKIKNEYCRFYIGWQVFWLFKRKFKHFRLFNQNAFYLVVYVLVVHFTMAININVIKTRLKISPYIIVSLWVCGHHTVVSKIRCNFTFTTIKRQRNANLTKIPCDIAYLSSELNNTLCYLLYSSCRLLQPATKRQLSLLHLIDCNWIV